MMEVSRMHAVATRVRSFSKIAEEDPSSRCELIAADLTQSVPAGADVFMLKHVLRGCRDAEAITILRNCRAIIPMTPKNGSLSIVDR